ncbi:DUF1150 family protein [Phaeovulum sp.]|uniref:DUF1150 family protein n=1 Tax=Phaeovulum sp. TaxID=2934796 RepID=UPI002731A6D6|nr:DUF1150 family protein [Phaeovulum sp.]MDP1668252.1 DUF1150 family protein [Phaeovulum sp.]MDZ4118100.1 DUF1150 family protein [Phaeovulum sp.]
MNTKFDFGSEPENRIVYVRAVAVADLPQEIRLQAAGLETLYAVHGSDGERLALVADCKLAFALARQHDRTPVHVH